MGVIKLDEIVAAWVENELVCAECLGDGETDDVEKIVTQDELDNSEDLYFCDRCKKRI